MSRRHALVLLGLALVAAAPGAGADDWTDLRVSALERAAVGVRADLDRRAGGGRGALERVRREVRSLHVRPSERGVALERLERRLIDLDRDADRERDRRRLERGLARPMGGSGALEIYRPPWPETLRGDDSLIGVGKLVVRVQRSLRRSAGGLDTDRRSAAGHLARAEGLLGRLERTAGRSDPTIIALRAEAARLSSLLID